MPDVREASALPNELRAAMVTWLPMMTAGVAADVLCAVSWLATGLLQRPGQRLLTASTGRSLALPE